MWKPITPINVNSKQTSSMALLVLNSLLEFFEFLLLFSRGFVYYVVPIEDDEIFFYKDLLDI